MQQSEQEEGTLLTTTRPKLRTDVFYIPGTSGVFFRSPQGSFEIRGQTVSLWVEKLVPYLNGQHTLAEITQGLDPQRQVWVGQLLETLQEYHCLKDVSKNRPHTLTAREETTYASALAYIDAFRDSAAYRFERFREQKVLVIGSGLTHMALVSAMLERSTRQLSVLTTQECATDTKRFQEYLVLRRTCDPRQILREVVEPDWRDESSILAVLERFDVILHISDRPMLERANRLSRLCIAQKKLFAQAVIIGTQAWLGPLTLAGQQGCWECAWLRFQGHLPADQQIWSLFEDHPTCSISHVVALPTASLIANLLSFELFKYCTEAGSQDILGNLISIDLTLPRIQKRPFLPHPRCSTCSSPVEPTRTAFLECIQHLEAQEPLDYNLFPKRAVPCFDDHFGLFSSLDLAGYAQLPLSICRVRMSRLPELLGVKEPLLLAGAGVGFYQARRRLIQRACEVYAANMIDQRRLISAEEAQSEDHLIRAASLLGGEAVKEVNYWIWTLHMQTRLPYLVPASLVFPVLHNQTLWHDVRPGIASGMNWAEAICRALLDWCKYLTVAQMEHRDRPYPQVDIQALIPHIKGNRQRRWFKGASEFITVYDVTGTLEVPTFALCSEKKTIVYSASFNPVQAIYQGFEQMVQQYQAMSNGHSEYALATVPDVPESLQGDGAAWQAYSCPQEWPTLQQWLQERLVTQGWHIFLAPLDHDPALARVFPYIVHVLLGRVLES